MHIIINNTSMIPIYEQIVDQIKGAIFSGELKENEPLPSVRGLSAELRISALTVKKAYDNLEREGYVITIHGKGTYIAPTNHDLALEKQKTDLETELYNLLVRAHNLGLTHEEITDMVSLLLAEL